MNLVTTEGTTSYSRWTEKCIMMWLKVKKACIEKVQKHIDGSSQNVPIWIWMQGPLTQKMQMWSDRNKALEFATAWKHLIRSKMI